MRLPTILIVGGQRPLRRMLRVALVTHGYDVIKSRSGANPLKMIRTMRPDLILLDINLPGVHGIDICRQIRHWCDAPIIVISTRSAQRDKVLALDAGADDYVVKPFDWEELLARIRAFLRRYLPSETMSSFACRDLAVDFEYRQVTVHSRPIHLGRKEFDLLRYLIVRKGRPVSHWELFHALWGPRRNGHVENLRVVINQLRKKIEIDPAHPRFIQTEPAVGYRFQAPTEEAENTQAGTQECTFHESSGDNGGLQLIRVGGVERHLPDVTLQAQ